MSYSDPTSFSLFSIEKFEQVLKHEFNTVDDLIQFFLTKERERRNRKPDSDTCQGYEKAFKLFVKKLKEINELDKRESFDNYFKWFIGGLKKSLINFVEKTTLHKENNHIYLPISKMRQDMKIELRRFEIFGLLSSTIFNVQWSERKNEHVGSIFIGDITIDYSCGIHRLLCLFAYLHLMIKMLENNNEMLNEIVSYERVKENVTIDWANEKTLMKSFPFKPKGIEYSDKIVHVDFANKYLSIHRIIASVTQEELLFSLRPECLIAMQMFECMNDNEAILMKNTMQISTSIGYQETFEFTGFCKDKDFNKSKIILAIDSCIHYCFGKYNITRDLIKSYVGFKHAGNSVATGQWGCGAFLNNPLLKLIQQTMVLSLLNLEADFHWMSEVNFNRLNSYVLKCVEKNMTIGQIYSIICSFDGDSDDFESFFGQKLEQ